VTKPRALFEARQTVQFVYIKCQLGMRGYTAGANALLLAIGALYFAPSHAFLSLAPLSLRPTTCAPAISANLPLVAARSASMSPSIFMLAKKKAADPDKPKRPLSAYFRFTLEKRKELKVSMPTLSNTEVVKKMGEMWRGLSPAQKKPYEEAAAKERAEYDLKYGKTAKDNQPKKPLSAYMLYSNAVRSDVKAANPTAKFGEIAKIIGKNWREMKAGEKEKWVALEQKNKADAAK